MTPISVMRFVRRVYDSVATEGAYRVIEDAINRLIDGNKWKEYTPTLTNVFAIGVQQNEAYYKYDGQTLTIYGLLRVSSGSVNGAVELDLPEGFSRKNAQVFNVGDVILLEPGVAWQGVGSAVMNGANNFRALVTQGDGSGIAPWSNLWIGSGGGDLRLYYNVSLHAVKE